EGERRTPKKQLSVLGVLGG
ncbi:MAG: bifunctional cephalosporin acylase/gamma-glutamyltranspeptidase, partial [Betaproteobacteria bacterium]